MTPTPGGPRPRRLGPLMCMQPQRAPAVRLVCFHHAGGGPGVFRRWPQELAPEVEVWTAELPGHGSRADEPFAQDWSALTSDLAEAVESHIDSGPLALLGHSLGAVIAYEVLQRLEQGSDRQVRHLFALACRAPHRFPDPWQVPDDDDQLLAEVDQRYGAVPLVVRREPDLLAQFVPILRADLQLATSYRWVLGPRLRTAITAVAGVDDKVSTPSEVEQWGEHTVGVFRALTLPGGHFFVDSELPAVLDIIRRALSPGGAPHAGQTREPAR